MTHLSHLAWLHLSAAFAGCSGQVMNVGSTGQALTQGSGGPGEPDTIAILSSPPGAMASDGTALYWTEQATTNLMEMRVQGGPTTRVAGPCSSQFLAVDSTSVYFMRDGQLYSAPKGSSSAAAVVLSDGSGSLTAAAVSQGKAFWAETPDQQPKVIAVKSAGLADRVASLITQYQSPTVFLPFQMGVTSDTVFLVTPRGPLTAFSLNGGTPDGGPPDILGSLACGILVSDESAAYCAPPSGTVTRTTGAGSTTPLTPLSSGTAAALDATFLYFGDKPASGAMVVKVPKLGGTPTVIAHEEATALAVDDTAVYWATPKGYIRRLLK